MAQHIDNLRGEQGGVYVVFGGTVDSYTEGDFESDVGAVDVMMAIATEDGSTLTSITQPDFDDQDDYAASLTYNRGDIIWGKITELTPAAGGFQLFFHKRATVA